jgi:hypothetical protein
MVAMAIHWGLSKMLESGWIINHLGSIILVVVLGIHPNSIFGKMKI